MSEEQKVFRRRPWWLIGPGLRSSATLTIAYTALLVSTIGRTTPATMIWDVLFAVALAFLVVIGIISIVHFARRSDL